MAHDFARELEALAALSRSFAAAHPALAPGLAAPSDDPDVERLIDGFSYLVHQVESLIDAAAKRAADPFAEILGPELLRPFPCATILELVADRTLDVLAGTEFESVPVEGTRCRFRTFAPARVIPWEVADAKLAWAQDRGQLLRIVLRRRASVQAQAQAQGASAPATLGSLFPLRLHLAGETRASLALLLALSSVESMDLFVTDPSRAANQGGLGATAAPTVRLPGHALRMWGLDASEALLPPEPWEHVGFRLLREYFLLPAKFAFVEIAGQRGWTEPLGDAQSIEIALRLGRALPANLAVTRDTIRTNCVPVVNVFETTAEPVRPTLARQAHMLRVAGLAPDHGEVYEVLGAQGYCGPQSGTLPIPPLTDFDAVADLERSTKDRIFYALGRSPRASGQKEDTTVRFVLPREGRELPPIESVSFDLLACNRDLPMALGVGDIKVPGPRTPKGLLFRNITAVTPYRAAPGGRTLQRRSLAMVAVSACSRLQVEVLKTLLHLLNLHTTFNGPAGLTALRRIRAVIDVTRTTALVEGERGMRQGSELEVRLDEAGLDGEGDAYVFAAVLARLFAHDAAINSFARTRARFEGTGRIVSFPARSGDETI
ncbi:type VI secretion system baseplate subunit TssF [Pendulispora albinea]|uniref:Type VI secretion system baseplate subunit TssF n=1 Tax=Pendulispora albinea TaxID=2741071 RepID=A0ABZ2LRX3_9BACT